MIRRAWKERDAPALERVPRPHCRAGAGRQHCRVVVALGPELSVSHVTGGACSTSDIVEADALVSRTTYRCTVPIFSGEVTAQAICARFRP